MEPIIFVPEYVNVSDIDHYQSRNAMMAFMWRPCNYIQIYSVFPQEDGVFRIAKPPIHYFVCGYDSDDFNLNSPADDNTIVEYFDSDIDFAKFARVVKDKPHCVQAYFIVNIGQTYHAVKTDDVSVKYTFDKHIKYQVVELLVQKSVAIEELIEKNDMLVKAKADADSTPFQLRDSEGNVVANGTKFSLQIIDKWEEDEDIDEEDLANLTEYELLYHNREWLSFNPFSDPERGYTVGCLYENGSEFTCETIDGTVYLKFEDMYFYNDLDNNEYDLFVGKDVPAKRQRVRIEYTEDGDLILSSWESRVAASNEFLKASCGVVTFEVRETPFYGRSPMKLRIIRR
ncbi:hypothetical protein EV183_001885 [Coemansia sp. RSA 2336]|nr:hypothetical protein EV183_001885 [Coemansia sp. RSA 2336]